MKLLLKGLNSTAFGFAAHVNIVGYRAKLFPITLGHGLAPKSLLRAGTYYFSPLTPISGKIYLSHSRS